MSLLVRHSLRASGACRHRKLQPCCPVTCSRSPCAAVTSPASRCLTLKAPSSSIARLPKTWATFFPCACRHICPRACSLTGAPDGPFHISSAGTRASSTPPTSTRYPKFSALILKVICCSTSRLLPFLRLRHLSLFLVIVIVIQGFRLSLPARNRPKFKPCSRRQRISKYQCRNHLIPKPS